MSVKTVKVQNVSILATHQDINEFFSFSGDIQFVDSHPENEKSQTVYVTFKDPQGADTAVLLSGATIVDQAVNIALAPDYNLPKEASAASPTILANKNVEAVVSAVQKAEDVVISMLAKGFTLSKDALNKAKAFDEQHNLTSTASARVTSFDQKIGLSEKFSVGTTMVNEKVKEMDQKFQVTEKTKSALATAEQSVSSAGAAVMNNRYVLTGATWVTGAFNRVVSKNADSSPQKPTDNIVSEATNKDDFHGAKVLSKSDEMVLEPEPTKNDSVVATNEAVKVEPAKPST